MTLIKAVAKRIKEILKERNLTQYALYKLTGVAQSTISTILKGEINTIRLSTIYELCAGLKIELSEFFDCKYLKVRSIED